MTDTTETNRLIHEVPITSPRVSKDEKLVLKIAEKYSSPDGAIYWTQAFTKHPAWKTKLGSNYYSVANALRGRKLLKPSPTSAKMSKAALNRRAKTRTGGKPGPKPKVALNGNGNGLPFDSPELPAAFEREVGRRIALIIGECGHCPKCGKNVGDSLLLASMQSKLG